MRDCTTQTVSFKGLHPSCYGQKFVPGIWYFFELLGIPSLKLTAKAPENGWLVQTKPVPFGAILAYIQGNSSILPCFFFGWIFILS